MKKYCILIFAFLLHIYVNGQNTYPFPQNGNVGLGTTNPVYKLDAIGSGRFSTGVFVQDGSPFGVVSSIGVTWANNTLIYKGYNYGDYAEILVPSSAVNSANIRLLQNGNVGIGTTSPAARLQVTGINAQPIAYFHNNTGSAGAVKGIVVEAGTNTDDYTADFRNSAGVSKFIIRGDGSVGVGKTNPTATLSVNGNFDVTNNGNTFLYNGMADVVLHFTDRGSGGRAVVHDAGNILTLNYGGDFSGGTKLGTQFYVSENASGTSYLNGGNVGIGTTDTKGYKFAVNGSMIATAVTVKTYTNWPDYVFKKKYSLMPLSKLNTFIDHHHHLPEIPTEAEVGKDGQNLGEMNKLLLKKVEELTLYLIEQNHRIEKMEHLLSKKK